MGFSIFDELFFENYTYDLVAASAVTPQTLIPLDGFPHRVDACILVNTDTIDHAVEFLLFKSSLYSYIGQVLVPASSGTPTVPPVDAIPLLPLSTLGGIVYDGTFSLKVRVVVTMIGASVIHVLSFGGKV